MSQFSFESLPPYDKRIVISRFLREYGKWNPSERHDKMQVVQYKGVKYGISYQAVCNYAGEYLLDDGLKAQKFEKLLEAMKKHGMDMFYFYTMGEHIEGALK